ncbi:MAG TPA: LLM class flavin-dependent oxidoreductase [Candidatus Binatia bacterium]|jgi:alkanesulfonate monooxygenase SsuD/methylene tetrahydromethanopterin reductase-like flavin-dependent oxidoreductase (luciferase family)
MAALKFGLVLPHFGQHASVERCLEGAAKAETYGFDSVWVRDHLVFTPYDMEGTDNTHIEGLLVLSAVASVTQKLVMGTAMTICHRNPIHLAQCFAGLSRIANGRVIMGMGLGGFPHEFEAVGLPTAAAERAYLVRINAELCRRFWAGEKVSYQDRYYNFRDVELRPVPTSPIPIWCGGSTPAACRRVVEFGDGWLPARITLPTFVKRMAYLREISIQAQRPLTTAGVMPLTSLAKDKETALRYMNVKGLIAEANKNSTWIKPVTGVFATVDDIHGLILAGTSNDIVRGARDYQAAGADLIVFDLRFRVLDWDQQIDWLGNEVLPALRVGARS